MTRVYLDKWLLLRAKRTPGGKIPSVFGVDDDLVYHEVPLKKAALISAPRHSVKTWASILKPNAKLGTTL